MPDIPLMSQDKMVASNMILKLDGVVFAFVFLFDEHREHHRNLRALLNHLAMGVPFVLPLK